jgi:prolyl oligopeptidase
MDMLRRLLVLWGLAWAGAVSGQPLAPPPSTPVTAATDTYFGVQVSDPYRWLEDATDPKVKAWTAAQSARTRAYLDALPMRAKLAAEIRHIITGSSPVYYELTPAAGRILAGYYDPKLQQPQIVSLNASADASSRRVVLDPNAMDHTGHTAIDWWSVSPNGLLLAVSISKNGSEDGSLHVFRLADGTEVEAVIPRVQYPTAGGSVAWTPDSSAFWYTRYPGPDAPAADQHYNVQVYFHRLGRDWTADPLALGAKDGLERISEVYLSNDNVRPSVIAMVARGDGGAFAHYLLRQGAAPIRVADYPDQIVSAVMGPDDALYGVSHAGAPNGKIVKLVGPATPGALARAPTLVPEDPRASIRTDGVQNAIPSIVLTKDRLFLRELAGGPTRVRVFDHAGRPGGDIPLPEIANVGEVDPMADGSVFFSVTTYLTPRRVEAWSPATNVVRETGLVQTTPVDFSDAKVTRVFATSKDGTKVPLNILSRRDVKLDGRNPTLLYGYGGYGISETPHFAAEAAPWLEAGGVYVFANIRGGAEYGESWHQDGALLKKQNVFDDFAACGQYLIDHGYTSHDKLALLGGSNGGLLMGATMTQHPELAQAVVSEVGIYDMLRVELDANGAFNTTEFGTVKNEDQFKALYAYSPYHHVRPGARYPAVLMTTGDNDGRVNPLHSRKFTAALQADSASDRPILLLTSSTSGHGIGDSVDEMIRKATDADSFLFDQLGVRAFNK